MVTMVVFAILGTLLARMLLSDSRFVSKMEAMMDARVSARAALNTTAVELRMVTNGGLTAASPAQVVIRAPYAWGVACGRVGGDTIVSLLPSDSMMVATAIPGGLAWRQADGTFAFQGGISVAVSGNPGACTADSIRVITGGSLAAVTMPDVAASGTPVYLYQTISYSLAASTVLPGRTALWRQVGGQPNEEMLAPLASTSAFAFFVGSSQTALAAAPADLSTVSGLELQIIGESEFIAQGASAPEQFDLTTRVSFLNREN